jgi:hypothetical protein
LVANQNNNLSKTSIYLINNNYVAAGVKVHFYYFNNKLIGLDDDSPDSLMMSSDVLANIKSYLNHNSISFEIQLEKQSNFTIYNIYLSFYYAHSTPCNTFFAGQSLQLYTAGGSAYAWWPQRGLSC